MVALAGYWMLFYLPIWRGRRYVGWDLTSYNLPLDRYVFEHLRWLSWPLYDPYSYNGVDFAGNIQSGMFYPPKLAMFLVLKATGGQVGTGLYEVFLLLHVLLFSALTYLVVRRLSGSAWLGLFIAVALTYSGFFQGQLEHLWYFTTLAWAPLALNELHRAVIERRRSGYVGYAVTTLVMLLAGYPLLFFVLQAFVVLFVLTIALTRHSGLVTRTAVRDFVLAWLVIVLLAAPIWVPFMLLVGHSVADLGTAHLSPRALATAWLPRALGDPANEHLAGTDVTNGYYFAGPLFYLAPLGLIALALRRTRASVRSLVVLTAAIALLGVAVFTSFVQATLHLSALRSWTLANCFFALVATAVVVAGIELKHRSATVLRFSAAAMTVASAVLLLVFNTPSAYDTPVGRWDDPGHGSLRIGSAKVWATLQQDSPVYAILTDPGTIRGRTDTWPRVLGIRNFGGFDPTAPKHYLEQMNDFGHLGDGGVARLVSINRPPNLDWLADNGLRYIVTRNPYVSVADPGVRLVYTGRNYDVYELTKARPLVSTPGCASISHVVMGPNMLAFDASTTASDCEARTTTNFASGWHAESSGMHLRAVRDGLGFTIGPLQPGTHRVVLHYRSTPLRVGFILFFVGIALCVALAAVALSRRRSRRA